MLADPSSYHSSYYVFMSFSNFSKEGESHFCYFVLCLFKKIFNSPILKWILIHQKYLLVTCVGRRPSPAAALAWARWCTGLPGSLHHTMWHLFKGPSATGCSTLQCTLYILGAHKYSYYTQHNYKALQNKNKNKKKGSEPMGFHKTEPQVTHHTCKSDTLIFSQLQSAFFALWQMWSMYLFLWSSSHFRVVHGILSLPLSPLQTCIGELSLLPCILKFSNSQAHKAKDNLRQPAWATCHCLVEYVETTPAFSYILCNYRKQISRTSPCTPGHDQQNQVSLL